jgi:hypothetical protein
VGPSILLSIFLSYEFIILSVLFVITHVSLPYVKRITLLSTLGIRILIFSKQRGDSIVMNEFVLEHHLGSP